VVDVHVDHRRPVALPLEPGGDDGDVVVDAEPGGHLPHRVVEAAGRVEGVVGSAFVDGLAGHDAPPRDQGAGLVHLREDRVVLAGEAGDRGPQDLGATQLVPVAELFHQLDVAGVMDEADLLRGRLARLQQLGMLAQAGLVDQLEGQLDAPRLKWMPVRMPVSAVRIVINQRHPARHLTTLGSVLRGGSAGA